jgi:hypothetical protein
MPGNVNRRTGGAHRSMSICGYQAWHVEKLAIT